MERTTITVTGVRGGHGASTIAAALALFAAGHGRTILTAHDPATVAALLGLPATDTELDVTPNLTLARTATLDDADVHVHDAGLIEHVECPEGLHVAVLRGPCYLGLRTLVTRSEAQPDGIVLVHERDRRFTARDVEDVTGLPVLAAVAVAVAPGIARCIDAGILPIRLHRLTEFAALRRYTTRLLAPNEALPDSAQATPSSSPAAPPKRPYTRHTDSPLARSASGRGASRPIARSATGKSVPSLVGVSAERSTPAAIGFVQTPEEPQEELETRPRASARLVGGRVLT